ncbi:MAG TPA: class II aldolase/adducin family protein [Caulobacteraceae bacterium]|nr:class II aldolase/adducin family protein [Caulobacteraceae bacterium]
MSDELRLRAQIVAAARALAPAGLGVNRSGNVSARFEDGLLITPTGVAYEALTPASLVFLRPDGSGREGEFAPSSEWRMHGALYGERPQCGAVVHCHSPAATALACAGRRIPAFHYMVAAAGGASIELAPYATFGTEALAKHALAAMAGGRRACLLANHGQLAYGRDVAAALELAREVEALADQYARVLAMGDPKLLGQAEMSRVLERFESYGQPISEGGTKR